MIPLADLTIAPARPALHSGLVVCPACAGYGQLPGGIGEDDYGCDTCDDTGSVPGPMPSPLACVRFDGWRSYVRTQLAYSGDRLSRGVDCRTQSDFAYLASHYGVAP